MSLTVIAIANAILWSGVILGLLLYLMRQSQDIEQHLQRLESQNPEETDESLGRSR